MTLLLLLAISQTGLAHRDSSPPATPPAHTAPGHDTLPPGADGEYQWREPGEVIQLLLTDHHLAGYLTRRSDKHQPESAPLTFSFTQASITNGAIQFTTRELHGEFYTFEGRVMPAAPAPRQGRWLLQGVLTLHAGGVATPQSLFAPIGPESLR